MQRLDSYTNLRAGMDLARQGDLAVPRLMSHPWRSQHDFYVEKFGKWKITKRITSKSSRFLLNAEWWMETIHVYTISGWSKLVEKWESKTFILQGEESWDDISFSWYQWNKIKADIWQTSWQNGTLKKHTSSTIKRSRFMLYLLQNMTFKNSNSTTQTYRNHKQNTQIPRATCVEFDLPSEWQTWLPRWGFVTLGVSSLECHKVRILDESIYLWGYPSLSRVSVLSSEHQSICQIHLPFFSDSADQWSSRKSNKLKPEPAGLGRGVS